MATKVYGTIDMETMTASKAVESRAVQTPMAPPKLDSNYEDENSWWTGAWDTTVDILKMPITAVKDVWGGAKSVASGIEKFSYAALIAAAIVAVIVLPKILKN